MTDVQHNPSEHTFTADVEGGVAELAYTRSGDTLTFTHTFVPPPARDQDVGTALVEAGLSYARDNGLTVFPQCPFVEAYMADHPGTQDLRAS